MANSGTVVSYRTVAQIEAMAGTVRKHLGIPLHGRIPMQWLLEQGLDFIFEDAYFEIDEDRKLGGAEARTSYHEPVITVSRGTYDQLERGHPRARMTIAHEVGHLLMHCLRPIALNKTARYDHHTDPEWQANVFAAALLMPRRAFMKTRSVDEAMKEFGVSRSAAEVRARWLKHNIIELKSKGKKKAAPKRRH
jgi:hypothetical protein